MSDLTSRCPGPRFPPPVPLDGNPGRVRNSNSIPYHTRISLLLAAAGLLVGSDIRAQEWTRFRGPNGTGISTARGIPSTWTTGSYAFQAKLPGSGLSSPVAWGNRVFVTAADTESGRRHLVCLSLADGKELWKQAEPFTSYKKHRQNTMLSGSTPSGSRRPIRHSWPTGTTANPHGASRWGHSRAATARPPHRSSTTASSTCATITRDPVSCWPLMLSAAR